MDLNATAKLPDGTESRGAWVGWMITGFFFGGLLAHNAISSAWSPRVSIRARRKEM